MVLSDFEIKSYVEKYQMITPFNETQIKKVCGKISWGLSSYGYDIRLDKEFYIFNDTTQCIIDPKNFDSKKFEKIESKECVVPANSYVLAKSVEYFKIPRNVIVLVFGKSTYARCGLIVNVTPLEPEWEGYITISIINPLNHGIKIYANEGIAQSVFLKSNSVCKISYRDKSGKYQTQKGITFPKIS